MHLTYRKTCRICGSSALTPVIDLGNQYLQGSFIKPGKETPPKRKISTEIVRCNPMLDENACGLLQTSISVPPEILYSSYWYRSGTNQTMRDHLEGIANVAKLLISKDDASVLDIGCNDGTLLKNYPVEFTKYGVDPSDVAQEVTGDITVVQDTFPSPELAAKLAGETLDIITSIAMFYDLEDPSDFVANIKEFLNKDGIWIFEMSYMPLMLEMNSYDTICHEHLEYYSFAVLENLLSRNGMKVVKVSFNDINGGSIRCHATHKNNFRFKNREDLEMIAEVRKREFDLMLDTDEPYKNFQQRINQHKEELLSILKGLKRDGKRIHIYGASTKGNTILQWCGINSSLIDYAADRNPDKDGAKTIGSDIPIISEKKSRAMSPDYYLVLPWHFKAEFMERESEMLDKGVGFIFPLPTIEIIKK
jgi:2-polyprenyl-3-methyl-5-hydroxy-6-metoxy-1,4-benzoquinol methylase